ncbi:hypothetical protein [Natrinema ejinorense]|nr:hypothetical protein [Natrinema ejinorense]
MSDDRAQLILIGAIALAFVILGIVVVYNGVLFTETLSSSETSQSASSAAVTEHELNQSVGCLLVWVEAESSAEDESLEDLAETNVSRFDSAYRNATVQSTPAVVQLSDIDANASGEDLQNVTVTTEYESHSLSYNRTRTIDKGCPGGGT